eukprot:326596_1
MARTSSTDDEKLFVDTLFYVNNKLLAGGDKSELKYCVDKATTFLQCAENTFKKIQLDTKIKQNWVDLTVSITGKNYNYDENINVSQNDLNTSIGEYCRRHDYYNYQIRMDYVDVEPKRDLNHKSIKIKLSYNKGFAWITICSGSSVMDLYHKIIQKVQGYHNSHNWSGLCRSRPIQIKNKFYLYFGDSDSTDTQSNYSDDGYINYNANSDDSDSDEHGKKMIASLSHNGNRMEISDTKMLNDYKITDKSRIRIDPIAADDDEFRDFRSVQHLFDNIREGKGFFSSNYHPNASGGELVFRLRVNGTRCSIKSKPVDIFGDVRDLKINSDHANFFRSRKNSKKYYNNDYNTQNTYDIHNDWKMYRSLQKCLYSQWIAPELQLDSGAELFHNLKSLPTKNFIIDLSTNSLNIDFVAKCQNKNMSIEWKHFQGVLCFKPNDIGARVMLGAANMKDFADCVRIYPVDHFDKSQSNIKISCYHVSCGSDPIDGKNKIGMILYGMESDMKQSDVKHDDNNDSGREVLTDWYKNGIHCKSGYIYIKTPENIKAVSEIGTIHADLYKDLFDENYTKNVVAAGFGYTKGVGWKFNSSTFNDNDGWGVKANDIWHDEDRACSEMEKKWILKAMKNWENGIQNTKISDSTKTNYCGECQCNYSV